MKSTDTLWHLGDFGLGFAWKERIFELRGRINCQSIHICFGNHDGLICAAFSKEKPDVKIQSLFKSGHYLKYGKICGRAMVLCHYAMLTWPWQHHNSIHIFGHSHSNLRLPQEMQNAKMLDVGCDTNWYGHEKYSPYSAEEVFYYMDTYKKVISLDHHQQD